MAVTEILELFFIISIAGSINHYIHFDDFGDHNGRVNFYQLFTFEMKSKSGLSNDTEIINIHETRWADNLTSGQLHFLIIRKNIKTSNQI